MNNQTAIAALLVSLMASAAFGQRAGDDSEIPLIIVNGQAEVSVKPDRAVIRLGAAGQAETAAAAQDRVNQIMQQAIEAIRQLPVPGEKIRTSGLSLSPVYSQPPGGNRPRPRVEVEGAEGFEPRIVAYRAHNTITVELDDLAKVGPVIDLGVRAGANQIQGLSFNVKNDTQARSQALTAAVKEARAKADAIAKAMNVELGGVWRVDEGTSVTPFDMGRQRMMAMEAATPIEPGQVSVQSNVTVQYRIEQDAPRRQ